MAKPEITIYIDFKSPYSYLAKDPAFALEAEFELSFAWRPYIFDIPISFGAPETRSAQQWRKVRYSYMDVRRWANQRGLIVYGPKKAFDSSLAAIGMLYAQRHGAFRAYADRVFERFFKRALDLEDPAEIRAVLDEIGAGGDGFAEFAAEAGRRELTAIAHEAESEGVFGVPTFILDGELFWGYDRIPMLRERLAENPE
ncbi:MAG: DsbA family protein [Alphaproteobacteria bacterium]|jgi:2-hydroxychromene-2-carboxylate isomerase|nr:DsbA family protein [Alphaproteobacteria bacterium]MDP6515145.1 DsbA family protein [Alphaproteobacteria bacterium]|tara:strand:+ start:1556 stop:2152 length:597 start_codon:yes stop_codon:yes gene_type:complete